MQVIECMLGDACSYDGRIDRLIDYQAELILHPGLYNETEYWELMCEGQGGGGTRLTGGQGGGGCRMIAKVCGGGA